MSEVMNVGVMNVGQSLVSTRFVDYHFNGNTLETLRKYWRTSEEILLREALAVVWCRPYLLITISTSSVLTFVSSVLTFEVEGRAKKCSSKSEAILR